MFSCHLVVVLPSEHQVPAGPLVVDPVQMSRKGSVDEDLSGSHGESVPE